MLNEKEMLIKESAEIVQDRYCVTDDKFPREVVLLKSRYCAWRKCTFCDYWADGESDQTIIDSVNHVELAKITGETGVLEVINSGSIFELPKSHIELIKKIIKEKNIHTLMYECHYLYKNKLQEFNKQFDCEVIVKTGLESFDDNFRESVLNKGFCEHIDVLDFKKHFQGVNLLIGIKGQTFESIKKDLELATANMKVVIVNVFTDNARDVIIDNALIKRFYDELGYLYNLENVIVYDHKNAVGLG